MQRDGKILGLRPGLLAAVIIIAAAAVASIAVLQRRAPAPAESAAPAGQKTAAAPAPKVHLDKLKWLDTPQAVPATPFTDGDGNTHTLADFAGKVLVVNFWATWCGPCVEEMPTLDALQAKLGGDTFAVVAISQDREGLKVAKPFAETNGWKNIKLYVEPAGHFARDAALRGLPTSIIVDRQGREVARLEGSNDWAAPEIEAKLRDLIAKQ